MLNEKNIVALKAKLSALGFNGGMEAELRGNICFHPEQFTIRYRDLKDEDVMNIAVFFKKDGDSEDYSAIYYDICLRKSIQVPADKINDIDIKSLEGRMSQINWHFPAESERKQNGTTTTGWKTEDEIESIILELNNIVSTTEGKLIADALKMKFWADSPLEARIPNFSIQKTQYEISQRFYFFDGEEEITIDEAYRFLCHRWREKQLNVKKRQADAGEENAPEESSNGAGKPVPKLLVKKRGHNKSKLNL